MNNKQPIVFVTGASGGIGKAIAESLTQKGYYVFATARSIDKLEVMRSKNLEPLQLDVTDGEAIQAALEHVKNAKGGLDILINNAGYGIYGSVEGVTQEDIRKAFDVNVFGLGQMTQSVLPLMRAQKSGTIVNVSSFVGKLSIPFLGWYAATKHAVEGLSDALRLEVKPFGIKVILIEPGSINTGFEDVAMATLEKANDPDDYHPMRKAFAKVVRSGYEVAPGPEAVAEVIYRAITANKPKARYTAGRDAKRYLLLKSLLSDGIVDYLLERQF